MSFKFDLTLSRLAAISVATSYINNSEVHYTVHTRIKESWFFSTEEYCQQYKKLFEKKLVEEIIQNLQDKLTKAIIDEVLYAIESILLKRFIAWQIGVYGSFRFIYYNLGKIHWTCYGAVDTAEIVNEEWTLWFDENGELKEDLQMRFPVWCAKYPMYYMACSCVLKTYIESHFCQMLEFFKEKTDPKVKEYDFIIYTILYFVDPASLKKYENLIKFKDFIQTATLWKNENIFARRMFSLSISLKCEVAARYYWEFLNSVEKYDCFIPEALKCSGVHQGGLSTQVQKDLTVFLLNKMTEEQRQEFFCHEGDDKFTMKFIMEHFIDNWPWEEVFSPAFYYIKRLYNKKDCAKLLRIICGKLRDVNSVASALKKAKYFRMFLEVFEEVRWQTSNGAPKLISRCYSSFDDVYLETFNFQILKLIIDFECEADFHKECLITPTYDNVLGQLVRGNKFHVLEEFMETVLSSQDEIKQWFKKYSDWHEEFVKRGDFEALENLLAWQFESEEERKAYKLKALESANLNKN